MPWAPTSSGSRPDGRLTRLSDTLADLAAAGAVTLREPLDLFAPEGLETPLPLDHLRLLQRSNGLEGYDGYYRLFGLGRGAGMCMQDWNRPALWKEAWQGRADGYLCFGETGWGDQYAYRAGEPGGEVVRIEAFSMEPEPVAGSFGEFMRGVFLPCAVKPRDELTVQARARFGRLPLADHVTFLEPPLAGELDPARVVRMPAVAAMRANAAAFAGR